MKVPVFASEAEEREFWDTHDVTEVMPGKWKRNDAGRKLSSTFAVRLDPNAVKLVREIARAHEMGPTQLVRKWIMDRLILEAEAGELAAMTGLIPDEMERAVRRQVVRSIMETAPEVAERAVNNVLQQTEFDEVRQQTQ